jgi:hypothetical protein
LIILKFFHITFPMALRGMFTEPPIGAISLEILQHHRLIPDVMLHDVRHPALRCHFSHEVAVIFTTDLALAPTTLQVDRRPGGVNVAEHERRACCAGRRSPLVIGLVLLSYMAEKKPFSAKRGTRTHG